MEVAASTRKAPSDRNPLLDYHVQTIIACGLLVIALGGAATYGAWRLYVAEIEAETVDQNRAYALLQLTTNAVFEKYISIAKALVVNARLTTPSENATETLQILTSHISDSQARTWSQHEHITGWLATEFGPSQPVTAPRKGVKTIALYRVTRGLPIRLASGKLVVPSQRFLFAQVRASEDSIQSIAKLDSLGRVLFVDPYATQISLDYSNFSKAMGVESPCAPGFHKSPADPPACGR
jgi:hypothetical protein